MWNERENEKRESERRVSWSVLFLRIKEQIERKRVKKERESRKKERIEGQREREREERDSRKREGA